MIDQSSLTDGENMALANLLIAMKAPVEITGTYKNWRGDTSERSIRLHRVWYGSTEYHKTPCLLLSGFDLDKNQNRDFKLADFDMSTIRARKATPND